MRWCRFVRGAEIRFGIAEGDEVLEVVGSPFDTYEVTSRRHPVSDVRLLTPCFPPTFYCAGLNYRAHIAWASKRRGIDIPVPASPDIGYRAQSALVAHGEPIVIPADSTGDVHYEGELVAVIGRRARHVTVDDALDYMLGYTCGNDVSERTWVREDRTLWRAKNSDTFKPMGPWIETDLDPTDANVSVAVNGETVSRFNTGNMIFGLAEYISAITRYITLVPGDVIWTGTDGATDRIAAGDQVTVAIEGIGELTNPVVAADRDRVDQHEAEAATR